MSRDPRHIRGNCRHGISADRAARDFAKRLPRGTYVALDDAEHEILMENDSIRARFWGAFDEFAIANQV